MHVAGVSGPVLGALGEQVQDHLLEVAGQFGTVLAQRHGGVVTVPDQHRPGVAEIEGRGAGGDLVQDAAEGVEVAAVVDLAARDLLGRHVVRGAHGHAAAGELGGEADVVGEAGDAEVADLHGAVGEPHDVGGLQVAVDDALVMGVAKGRGHLLRDVDDHVHGQRSGVVVLQELAEVAAFEELHDEVEGTAGGAVVAEVVDDGDAPVLEGRGHARLTPEPLAQHLGEMGVLLRPDRLEALHRDLPAQRFVAGAPHLAHAAAPDQIERPVPALDQSGLRHVLKPPPLSCYALPGRSSMAADVRSVYGEGRLPGPMRRIAFKM